MAYFFHRRHHVQIAGAEAFLGRDLIAGSFPAGALSRFGALRTAVDAANARRRFLYFALQPVVAGPAQHQSVEDYARRLAVFHLHR